MKNNIEEITKEITDALESGTTSLSPSFLAYHVAALRCIANQLASEYMRLECAYPDTVCSECSNQCLAGQYEEAFSEFLAERYEQRK